VLIYEVVITVDRPAGNVTGRVVWEGGATTDIAITLPRKGFDSALHTEQETVEVIRRLATHYTDAAVARLLARQGRITAAGLAFTAERVAHVRRKC
jgi:hypothetical protein